MKLQVLSITPSAAASLNLEQCNPATDLGQKFSERLWPIPAGPWFARGYQRLREAFYRVFVECPCLNLLEVVVE